MRYRRLVREDLRGRPEPEVHLRVAGGQRVQTEGLRDHHGPGQGNRKFNKIIEISKDFDIFLGYDYANLCLRALPKMIMTIY